jgi:hypothetical protein
LTGNVLAGYLKARVAELHGKGQVQNPTFLYDPQRDVVFIDNVKNLSGNLNIKFGPAVTEDVNLFGASLQLLDTNPLLSNPPASSNPWIKPLTPGVYKLQSGTRTLLFEVPANTGDFNVQFP